ncbi:hypothetical protein ACFLW0_05115 [Chloroflexota bacterium]
MPEKTKEYKRVIFTPEAIKSAVDVLREVIPEGKLEYPARRISFENESWSHATDEEFFADYIRGFDSVSFSQNYRHPKTHVNLGSISVSVYEDRSTVVSVSLANRADVEKVFNVFEMNVDNCRLPTQPKDKDKTAINWVVETIDKIETHCPIAAHKVRLALVKLESDDIEEWQNATMLVRDAWIELSHWLCQVKAVDTSDLEPDAVIARLKKLGLDKADERLHNLARASFSLYGKHHKRDIELDTAAACVISTVASMKTVIREVLNA